MENGRAQDSETETKIVYFNNQLLQEKQKMQHPPRPQIRSSKIIPIPAIRKTMTPNMLQEENEAYKNQESRSMRETIGSMSNVVHNSLNQIDNVEYLEISRNNYGSSANMTFEKFKDSNLISCSFKIRNFGCSKSKIKQNIIPLKLKAKPIAVAKPLFQDNSTIQTQGIEFIKLQNYPQNLHLHYIGTKIGYMLLEESKSLQTSISSWRCENWALIISQSIFYGQITSQTNLLKLKYLMQTILKEYAGVKVILKLYSQRNLSHIVRKFKEKQLRVAAVIWSKSKHYEIVNCIDLTDILPVLHTSRYIVIEDMHEVIKNIYYQTHSIDNSQNNMNVENCEHDQDTEKQRKVQLENQKIDNSCKYLYLKMEGLANLVKFCQKLKIFESADELCVQKASYQNITDSIIQIEQLVQKIKISEIRKVTKQKKLKYEIKYNKANESTETHNKQQQLKQLKNRIFDSCDNSNQNSRKESREKKIKEGQGNRSLKSVKKKRDTSLEKSVRNAHPYEGLIQDLVCDKNKPYNQLIQQITKNNLNISKQINKFREKTIGLFIQQSK